ncbi:MAG: hypothetical protein GY809_17070 [Planctomycetes bacterium]|nr:hypothetical protein [Planctomycetota bacterium]
MGEYNDIAVDQYGAEHCDCLDRRADRTQAGHGLNAGRGDADEIKESFSRQMLKNIQRFFGLKNQPKLRVWPSYRALWGCPDANQANNRNQLRGKNAPNFFVTRLKMAYHLRVMELHIPLQVNTDIKV